MISEELKQKITEQINAFADKELSDIDPQKTKISVQLDRLKPEMERIAAKYGIDLADVFIIYMDMNTATTAKIEQQLQEKMKELEDL
ncbi:MAG: hypothetical protein ACLRZ7_06525 [Lachnospiraceae bacterium]